MSARRLEGRMPLDISRAKEQLRELRELLAKRGIRDERVLDAMQRVPREIFVPAQHRGLAYFDRSLPLASGQTISQPYIVARMTEMLRLKGGESVLEIGTGSGYQTAVLALIASHVVTIERIAELQHSARAILGHMRGGAVIEFQVGDGTLGWPPLAPYDAIIVTAAAPSVPDPLYQQLKSGGRLVLPVGTEQDQILEVVEKGPDGPIVTTDCFCRFVPLIGEAGWKAEEIEQS
jgi:protein-L-isoaspartate(D-aspartate) O-methyltransferase